MTRMARRRIHILIALFLSLAVAGCRTASTTQGLAGQQGAFCTVYFSPHGGCTEHIVKAIGSAKRSILVQAYSFTSQPIAEALVETQQRGVKVEVIVDKSQLAERHSVMGVLLKAGVPVAIDASHAIAHNKVIVIDGETVLTGSFNFTESAEERNAENLLQVDDQTLAVQYAANWQRHRAHSSPYGQRGRF